MKNFKCLEKSFHPMQLFISGTQLKLSKTNVRSTEFSYSFQMWAVSSKS